MDPRKKYSMAAKKTKTTVVDVDQTLVDAKTCPTAGGCPTTSTCATGTCPTAGTTTPTITSTVSVGPISIAPITQSACVVINWVKGSMGNPKHDYPPSDWTLIQEYMNKMIHDGKEANNSFFLYQKIPAWIARSWSNPFVSPWVTGPIPQSHVPHAACDCDMDFNEVDPVYSGELFMTGIGLGYEASPIFIAELDDMQEFTSEDDCPENAINYILHINRLTEKPITNREI